MADQCQVVKTRSQSYRRVLTWFASRWRNHQPKRAEKPHSKFSVARRWTALLRGRRLRLPWRIASGSRQPPRGARLMSARERERGGLPSPDLSLSGRKAGQGLIVLLRDFGHNPSLPSWLRVLAQFWRRQRASLLSCAKSPTNARLSHGHSIETTDGKGWTQIKRKESRSE